MKWLLDRTIPTAKIFQIACTFDEFGAWLKKEHGKVINEEIFRGYKYFLDCAFSAIFDSIASDDSLGIKSDFLLSRALGKVVYVEKLPNSCEKTILLKNIYRLYKPISKSNSFVELKANALPFQRDVISIIEKIFSNCYSIKKSFKITKDSATELLLIDSLYILFNQIKNNGPVAYEGQLLKEWWPSKKERDTYLEGYKYTIQFVWHKVIGTTKYRKSSLKNIHQSDSWRDYVYNKPHVENPKSQEDLFSNMMNKSFDLEKQTSFDSYFYRIQSEIIRPLEKKYNFFMERGVDVFQIHKAKFSKSFFENLLTKSDLTSIDLSLEEELDMILYWYPVEIVNNETTAMHNGIPAFITLLAGTAALLNKQREFDKVMVCKFIHPREEENGNDYSFGVLIDAKASAGHYSSGWMIFYDCCGDYSGFSGSEYNHAEAIIKKYQNKRLLKLATKKVQKNEFKVYLAKYLSKQKSLPPLDTSDLKITYITEKGEIEVFEKLDAISELEQKKNFISDSKGIILELISYYAATKYIKFNSYINKDWSIESGAGEMDVIIDNEKEALLIECKMNVNNHSADLIISKAKNKLLQKFPHKKHLIEIWSWLPVSNQNLATFINNNCNCYSLSTDRTLEFLNHLRLSKITSILNYK
ncbi:MAG: hypothetical protein IPP32_02890 [Bacteroidetes bacterium]|nr:hypothetical protein [Bacteroidota bacterium]